jgi:hypothetical protein
MKRRTRVVFGPATLLSILLFLLAAAGSFASDTVALNLFPTEAFQRDTGKPTAVVRTFTVPATTGTFTLHVTNGDGATDNLVSSAVIRVNGATIVTPSDLNQHVATLDRSLTNLVKGKNTLEVEVRSIPSSYIMVSVEGIYQLGVRITDPAPSASVSSDKVSVHGTWAGYADDVGVAVNGIPAAISGNTFVATDVPLVTGSNTLNAAVTTFDGIQNTDAVIVTATGVKPFLSLWANYASGVSPFTASFKPEVEGITPVEYRYDFDGDGTVDFSAPAGNIVSFIYQTPGTYRATVTAIDGSGQQFTAEKTIVAAERTAVDVLLSGRWNALSTSFRSQDIEGGMVCLLSDSREKYRSIFTPLSAQLPTIFASVSLPELIAVEGNVAQYRVKREQMWEGAPRTITYYLWFVRDQDGIWRLDKF